MAVLWAEGQGVVTLPSGRRIRGGRVRDLRYDADWSLVLTAFPRRVDAGEWVCWPDFGLPLNSGEARRAIARAWTRSSAERVQIACGGGVGRTGTALAACAVLEGMEADAAIAHIRREYHPRAVETPWQRRWLSHMRRRQPCE